MRVGIGGLLCDEDGNQITWFSGHIGCTSNMHVELATISYGLSVVKEFYTPLVIAETDSMEAVHLISKGDGITHALGVFIDNIRKFLYDSPLVIALYTFL